MTSIAIQTIERKPLAVRRKRGRDRIGAGLMLLATVVAIVWANSPWGAGYEEFWGTVVRVDVGGTLFSFTVHELVNDGLMTLFFFLVGLEVKREFAIGELTSRSRAVLPVAAAIAGLALPALIFVLFTMRTGDASAWGIVISTDTAFLIGALAIIGPKYPMRLRVFLLTLAVVDDIGALLVIAFFYSSGIQPIPLAVAVVLLVALAFVRFLPAGRGLAYTTLGIALWAATYLAGIHPTLAGVAVALLIPVFAPRRGDVERTAELTRAFRESPNTAYAAAVTRSVRDSISINERVDAAWRPYVELGVLPLFALANAGVHLTPATLAAAVTSPITWGVVVGLVVGKFVGITGITALLRAVGAGKLAPGLGMHRIAGGAALSGIGFTIALFLVPIAIEDPEQQDLARVGILAASVIAFAVGWAVLTIGDRLRPPQAVGAKLNRPVDVDRDHIRGRVDAPLTIVEYGDFECPFCSRATGSIDAVREHFGSELRWVFRHLPLEQVHPHAVHAARAVEAAAMQGRFFEMAVVLFRNQANLDDADLLEYARQIGLDEEQFLRDARSPEVARRVRDDAMDAELMDLHSTPTFYIGGKRHVGFYDSRTLIAALEASRG
ncbi:Na+/H+ antiporter NhaA [Microbacterium sp. X-17]|uniref:Na+/H+ antiporter NhaA n=1 Tax=Microbacterium sp. X-17 TaxID=3144404 RepID=UPI0031F51C9B